MVRARGVVLLHSATGLTHSFLLVFANITDPNHAGAIRLWGSGTIYFVIISTCGTGGQLKSGQEKAVESFKQRSELCAPVERASYGVTEPTTSKAAMAL